MAGPIVTDTAGRMVTIASVLVELVVLVTETVTRFGAGTARGALYVPSIVTVPNVAFPPGIPLTAHTTPDLGGVTFRPKMNCCPTLTVVVIGDKLRFTVWLQSAPGAKAAMANTAVLIIVEVLGIRSGILIVFGT